MNSSDLSGIRWNTASQGALNNFSGALLPQRCLLAANTFKYYASRNQESSPVLTDSKFQKAKRLFKHAHLSIEMEPILQSGAMWMAFSCPEQRSILTLPRFRYRNLLLLCYLAHNWVFSWGQPPVSQLREKKEEPDSISIYTGIWETM